MLVPRSDDRSLQSSLAANDDNIHEKRKQKHDTVAHLLATLVALPYLNCRDCVCMDGGSPAENANGAKNCSQVRVAWCVNLFD
jgi:hypothetical protein